MWRRHLAAAGLLALSLAVLPNHGAAQEKTGSGAKAVDLAICLDTSNSMDGLIGSVKTKLWDIVNDLAKAKPTPHLRVALFSYGNTGYDPSTGWVKKDLDFTTDLDKVNEQLFGLRTRGGEEYVARVCRDALQQLEWTKDPAALKIIFVCGNEAVDQDKLVALPTVAKMAIDQGVIINTIYCGSSTDQIAPGWKQFADLAEGRFASIDQDRGTVAIATPFDKELAELSGSINLTFCFSGKDAKLLAANQARQDVNAAQVGGAVAASRAASKAGALYRFQDDLVEKLKSDKSFDVSKLPEEELPEELRKLKPEEREKHLKDLFAKREELQKKIADLAKKRDAFIAEEAKKNPNSEAKAFDEAVRALLRDQAKKKGLEIPA